jgi:hypothetical protein
LGRHWCAELGYAREGLDELGVTGAIICASDLRASELNHAVQELLDARTHVQL